MFKYAIVRRPGHSISEGITSAKLGQPVYQQALKQHDMYIKALEKCEVKVTVLEAEEKYPDSVFVEDTAVLANRCVIITNPGARTRQGEETTIKDILKNFYSFESILSIKAPGTIEGGDVMRVGNHFYVGLSARTNEAGFQQFEKNLKQFGYTASIVQMKEFLHLKTGLSYLEDNNLLIAGEFIGSPEFEAFNQIPIDKSEEYSANCIRVNNYVLLPLGYPKTKKAVKKAGYNIIEVDVSEFRKLDGGLSCLSLRF
ncbi:MAG: N(G),N(G)-dimethylarginine dimethylaminohydrolase [bacterium]|nr:N(G),N(G)-dimethylarginine dimethylaminohydrolase [bacterium]